MSINELDTLKAEVRSCEENISRIRAQNQELSELFKSDPSDENRGILRRGAAELARARDLLEEAKVALLIFEKTGQPNGLIAKDGSVLGRIAVLIPPGTTQKARLELVDNAVSVQLHERAAELGVVLSAAPNRYARERPGRNGRGETVFDVAGRVEGGLLTPLASPSAQNLRN